VRRAGRRLPVGRPGRPGWARGRPSFDVDRLDATRRALLRKRAREAARTWPRLAASLGADWPEVFARHRAGHQPVGALRDGWDTALALRARTELAPAAAAELAEREAILRYDGRSAPRRRVLARFRQLPASRRRRP